MCVPMPRCMPEHLYILISSVLRPSKYQSIAYRMHMKTPRFQLAHRGSTTVSLEFDRVQNLLQRTLITLAIGTALICF
jgi:hypothetical protein